MMQLASLACFGVPHTTSSVIGWFRVVTLSLYSSFSVNTEAPAAPFTPLSIHCSTRIIYINMYILCHTARHTQTFTCVCICCRTHIIQSKCWKLRLTCLAKIAIIFGRSWICLSVDIFSWKESRQLSIATSFDSWIKKIHTAVIIWRLLCDSITQ